MSFPLFPSHPPVFSSFPLCLFISYFLSHPAISQLFPAPPLPLLPNTLGSLLRQESALGPPCDSSSDRCEDASAFLLSQDGLMSADSLILKVTDRIISELKARGPVRDLQITIPSTVLKVCVCLCVNVLECRRVASALSVRGKLTHYC